MEKIAEQGADRLFQYGALGVIALVLIAGVVWLVWSMNKRHALEHAECREDRAKTREEITAVTTKSREEMKAITSDYHEQSTQNINILRELVAGVKATNEGQTRIEAKLGTACQWTGNERRR